MSLASIIKSGHYNPWLIMPALVLLVYGTFLAAQWPLAGSSLFGYISFNSKSVDASESAIPQRYVSHTYGYDGQFYYRLSLDPFSSEERVQGIRFDHPPLRQQRILLPLLTRLIARGDLDLSATVMLTINLLAIAGLTLVGGALLKLQGLSAWPSLLLAFYPGFAVSVERFLTEPLSCLLLLFSLLCLAHKKVAWGGIVLALAILARETALIVALTAAGIWTLQTVFHIKIRLWKAPGPAYWLPGVVTYVFWQLWLQNNWSASPLSLIEHKTLLGWPLAGFVASVWQLLTDWSIDNSFFLFMMLATLAWIVTVAFMFRASQGPFRWIWLAYLLVATLLGTAIWNNSPSFLRVTTELNLLGMLVYLLAVRTPHRWVLTAWLGCWLLSAGAEGYRMHLIDQARTSVEINTAS